MTKTNNNNSDSIVLTMDLDAVLLYPKLQVSSLYYNSKHSNFTVFNNTTRRGHCFSWHEFTIQKYLERKITQFEYDCIERKSS